MGLISTIKFHTGKKIEPVFNDYQKIITDFSELTPKTMSPFDLGGRQYYVSGPSQDGLFVLERMNELEKSQVILDFYKYYGQNAPERKYEWEYKSMACNSFDKFRINIQAPGRIVMKCTLPRRSWAAGWLYSSMNKGDFTKPKPRIDNILNMPREYYFEADIFETMMEPRRAAFSIHYGTQAHRMLKTSYVSGLFRDFHYPEVVWDGYGNWKWYLDGIETFRTFIPQPKMVFPYFKLTLGVWDYIAEDRLEWKVDYVKFSSVEKIW